MELNEYIKKISGFPLLSPEEETELFSKLRTKEMSVKESKSQEEKDHLAIEISQIRKEILKRNLRLVISIARKLHHGKNLNDIVDLIDEGNLGLMEAIDRFDLDRGVKFSTYAYWWVRQRIKAAIMTSNSTLSASIHLYRLAYHIRSYLLMYAKDNLNYNEVAEFLKVPVDKVKKAVPLLGKIVHLEEPLSFDGAEGSSTVGDTIQSSYNPIEEKEMQWLREFIHDFLENNIFPALENREVMIVKNRYGLNEENEEKTLQEIADILNLSAERIRQLEKESIYKIRKMNVVSVLKDLLPYGDQA